MTSRVTVCYKVGRDLFRTTIHSLEHGVATMTFDSPPDESLFIGLSVE
jgi:hypothetical protein